MSAPSRPWPLRIVFGLLSRIPAAVVLCALLGLLWWGHQNHWKLDSFAKLTGRTEAPAEQWCEEHNVPEDVCIECRPELFPKRKATGWCEKHRIHECPLDHPEVAELTYPPSISEADKLRAEAGLAFHKLTPNALSSTLHTRRIQFANEEAVKRAGVYTEPAEVGPVQETVGGPGELGFDPARTARISPRLAGSVFRMDKKLGDPVAADEVVALIDAPEVAKAKAELVAAVAQVRLRSRLLKSLTDASGTPMRTVTEMQGQVDEAKLRQAAAEQGLAAVGLKASAAELKDTKDDDLADAVRLLGLPEVVRKTLPADAPGTLVPVVTRRPGVVIDRAAGDGDAASPDKPLLTTADADTLLLTLDIRAESAAAVAVGQSVTFTPDGGEPVTGKVAAIRIDADPKSRTVQVRADVPNRDRAWKANTFGRGEVVVRREEKAVLVKDEAVHTLPQGTFVFVQDRDYLKSGYKVFHPRTVRVGGKTNTQTEILVGLLPGEVVVTDGSGGLRAELLRGNMGAGCACGH